MPRPSGTGSSLPDLLADDTALTDRSHAALRAFDPAVDTAFTEVNALYAQLGTHVRSAPDDPLVVNFIRKANALEATDDELRRRVESDDVTPSIAEARTIWHALRARQARHLLLFLCWRHFRWGATDLWRLRLTAAAAYLRQQAEALALMRLFQRDHLTGAAWMAMRQAPDGQRFARDTQSRVQSILREIGLDHTREPGEPMALHIRLASAVERLWRMPGTAAVLADDVDLSDLFAFHVATVHFLRVQERILTNVPAAFPELDMTGCQTRIGSLAKVIGTLTDTLHARYPDKMTADANGV